MNEGGCYSLGISFQGGRECKGENFRGGENARGQKMPPLSAPLGYYTCMHGRAYANLT